MGTVEDLQRLGDQGLRSSTCSIHLVVGIDSYFDAATGQYQVKQYTGDETRTRITKWTTPDWVVEVQKRGAGEISAGI